MIKVYFGPHIKYPLFLLDVNETWIFSTDFRKIIIIKFHENPCGGSRIFMWTDRHLDMTKLIVALRNYT
jgi:hypothetical protein